MKTSATYVKACREAPCFHPLLLLSRPTNESITLLAGGTGFAQRGRPSLGPDRGASAWAGRWRLRAWRGKGAFGEACCHPQLSLLVERLASSQFLQGGASDWGGPSPARRGRATRTAVEATCTCMTENPKTGMLQAMRLLNEIAAHWLLHQGPSSSGEQG